MPHFVDTNVALYAVKKGTKQTAALAVLRNAIVSVQVLNEAMNVARKKWQLDWPQIDELIDILNGFVAEIKPLNIETHLEAREVAERYRLSVYDSLLIASALQNGCDTFFSEDLHDGLLIKRRLTIRNPFA